MRDRSTSKKRSRAQEDLIADRYDGRRTAASGAAVTDPGDVVSKADDTVFEAKCKGTADKYATSMPVNLKVFEKAFDEACELGMNAALALCMHNPDSPLADRDGDVHFIVRLLEDDAARTWR